MYTIVIEALTPINRTLCIKLYKNIAQSRLFSRKAKSSINYHFYLNVITPWVSLVIRQYRNILTALMSFKIFLEIELESSTSFQGDTFGARPQMAPQYGGEQSRSATQSSLYEEDEDRGPKSTSYEELRKKHREKQSQGPRRVPHLPKEEVSFKRAWSRDLVHVSIGICPL